MKTNDKKEMAKRLGIAGGLAALMASTGALVFFWQRKKKSGKEASSQHKNGV